MSTAAVTTKNKWYNLLEQKTPSSGWNVLWLWLWTSSWPEVFAVSSTNAVLYYHIPSNPIRTANVHLLLSAHGSKVGPNDHMLIEIEDMEL